MQVEPEHLLLGMIEVTSSSGFFGCKVSADAAKREVQSALGSGKLRQPASPHQKDAEFSPASKKLLENALTVDSLLHCCQLPLPDSHLYAPCSGRLMSVCS